MPTTKSNMSAIFNTLRVDLTFNNTAFLLLDEAKHLIKELSLLVVLGDHQVHAELVLAYEIPAIPEIFAVHLLGMDSPMLLKKNPKQTAINSHVPPCGRFHLVALDQTQADRMIALIQSFAARLAQSSP